MQAFTVIHPTYAKKRIALANTLKNDQKRFFPKNYLLHALKVIDAGKNHVCIELSHNAGTWYFYRPHLQFLSNEIPTDISQAGIDLIKAFESFRATPYYCSAGVLTIGYGHTKTVQSGQAITQAQADQLLRKDLDYFVKGVRDRVSVPLTQYQFDALVSFAFNCGITAFAGSTLRKKLNAGNYAGAAQELLRWNKDKANGKPKQGLIRRRKAEKRLFERDGEKFVTHTPKPINLDVPHFSQRDNTLHPSGTCNVTSVAMVLAFFGIPQRYPQMQYEDELLRYMNAKGLRRHYHSDLSQVMEDYGIQNRFTTEATWDEVKAHLRAGNPVIISGKFTSYGHIIVLRGYDDKGFFVNDPWGEHMPGGWYKNASGKNLHYSYRKVFGCSYGGSKTTWAHFPKGDKL